MLDRSIGRSVQSSKCDDRIKQLGSHCLTSSNVMGSASGAPEYLCRQEQPDAANSFGLANPKGRRLSARGRTYAALQSNCLETAGYFAVKNNFMRRSGQRLVAWELRKTLRARSRSM